MPLDVRVVGNDTGCGAMRYGASWSMAATSVSGSQGEMRWGHWCVRHRTSRVVERGRERPAVHEWVAVEELA